MKKIAIVIGIDFHARSLIESGVLAALAKEFDVHLILPKSVKDKFVVTGIIKEHLLDIDKELESKSLFLLNVGTWKFRKRSTSFRFRLKRRILGDRWPEKGSQEYFLYATRTIYRTFKLLLFSINSISGLYKFHKRKYLEAVRHGTNLYSLLYTLKPDCVVIWTQNSEPTMVAGLLAAQDLKLDSTLVVDNWDNLCSKSILLVEPKHIIVFGKQSYDFMLRIQEMSRTEIHMFGSARFDVYLKKYEKLRNDSLKRILFAGSAFAEEDEKILQVLSACIGRFPSGINWSLEYRPHPRPHTPTISKSQLIEKFPSLQIHDFHVYDYRDSSGTFVWPNLEETAKQLILSDIVVAAPTTLLLEAIICGKPVGVPAFEEQKIRTCTSYQLNHLEHLNGIENIRGVSILRSHEEVFSWLASHVTPIAIGIPDKSINEFVTWDGISFAKKLSEFLHNA